MGGFPSSDMFVYQSVDYIVQHGVMSDELYENPFFHRFQTKMVQIEALLPQA